MSYRSCNFDKDTNFETTYIYKARERRERRKKKETSIYGLFDIFLSTFSTKQREREGKAEKVIILKWMSTCVVCAA